MKKILSILIAISLIISILPIAFADGETAGENNYKFVYDFNISREGSSSNVIYLKNKTNITDTFNMWEWLDASASSVSNNVRLWGKSWRIRTTGGAGTWFALKIIVPVTGTYNITYNYCETSSGSTSSGGYGDVYLFDKSINTKTKIAEQISNLTSEQILFDDIKYFGSSNSYSGEKSKENVVLNADEYILVFKTEKAGDLGTGAYTFPKSITLTSGLGTDTVLTGLSSSVDVVELDTVDVSTANMSVTAYKSDFTTEDVTGSITYKSSNESVVTVAADGTITAVGGGTATVWAETKDYNEQAGTGYKSTPVTVTVTAPAEEPEEPGEAVEDTTVSVAVQSENTDKGTVSWSGATVDSVKMGDTITATATPKDDYEFKFWKNSSGQVLSDKASESFVINTNSAITAVFDKVDDTADTVSVELYNANGMPFYTNETVAKDTTFANAIAGVGAPSYTGFGLFKHWSMYADESKIADDMLIKKNTRAVAIFDEPTEEYTVKVNGTARYSDVLYGKDVTVFSDASDFSYWKLGDEIVSYDKAYTFTVWGDVDLVEVTGEDVEEAPVAVLDEVDGNPLLIYSVPADYTVVEAGILFGSTADITISSVDGGRAAATRGTGQFTAQPKAGTTPAHSRGYLIFKNTSGEIRILYAD